MLVRPFVFLLSQPLHCLMQTAAAKQGAVVALDDIEAACVVAVAVSKDLETMACAAFGGILHLDARHGFCGVAFLRNSVEQQFDVANGVDVSVDVEVGICRRVFRQKFWRLQAQAGRGRDGGFALGHDALP